LKTRGFVLRFFVWPAVLIAAAALSAWIVGKTEKARRHTYLVEASQHRDVWASWVLPPPDTPVNIESPFGRFTIPLANIADRVEFISHQYLGEPLKPKHLDPLSDKGFYRARSFTVAFWMPDGAGVMEPDHLPNHTEVSPADLRFQRAPFRPREMGRPDPSPERFVVVVGVFCPREGGPLPAPPQGEEPQMGLSSSLIFYGYGAGALELFGCHAEQPSPNRVQVPIQDLSRTEMSCQPNAGICFGWLDLPDYGVRALTFLPADAVQQVPAVAVELHSLLKAWSVPH